MAALKIFMLWVSMETLIFPMLLLSRTRFTSFSLHLPTSFPFESISPPPPISSSSRGTFHFIPSALKSSRRPFHSSLQAV